MIGQPEGVFKATAERMQDKGLIKIISEAQVQLTEEGRVMTNTLFSIAQSQEEVLLEGLDDQQIRALKDGLKNVAQIDDGQGSQ